MDLCPSNTTECLLRAIYNAQNDYNWDPLTFGVTVAIGILALIVAATTVFQGALSAGPGRLKASSRAIGPFYYSKSRTEFSWTELRFRTTARIPYIDHLGYSLPSPAKPLGSRYHKHASYGAGWLHLIEPVPKEWPLIYCQTDYLPSDVQAAPARASIRAIVELAALSGCDSIETVKELPLARGLGLQLSFRDHPYLGLVAVYDQFAMEDDKRLTDVRKCHLFYLAGQFSFQGTFIEGTMFDGKLPPLMSTKSMGVLDALYLRARPQGELSPHQRVSVELDLEPGTNKSMGLGLLTFDSPDNCRALPCRRLRVRSAALQLCQTSQVWKYPSGPQFMRSLYDLFQSISNKVVFNKDEAISTELASEPLPPTLGWTWLANQSVAGVSGNTVSASRMRSRGPLHGKLCWFEWTPNGPGNEILPILPGSGSLVLLSSAFEICASWLANETLIDQQNSKQKAEARALVGFQLQEVDHWLLYHGGVKPAEQIFGILMNFVEKPRPPSFERNAPSGQREYTERRSQYHDYSSDESFNTFTRGKKRESNKKRNNRGERRRQHSDDFWVESTASTSDESDYSTSGRHRGPRVKYRAAYTSHRYSHKGSQPKKLDNRSTSAGAIEDISNKNSVLVLRQNTGRPGSRPRSMEDGTIVRGHEIEGNGSREQIAMTEPEINEDRSLVLHRGRRQSNQLLERPRIVSSEAAGQEPYMQRYNERKPKHPSGRSKARLPSGSHRSSGQLRVPDTWQRQSSDSSQIIRGRLSPADEGMKTLLIYRAILFATLCALAADTSNVFENELGRRIVQVL